MRAAAILLLVSLQMAVFVTRAAEFDEQRVFTVHSERERLDRARADRSAGTDEQTRARERQAAASKTPPPPEVRLQGFLRRSDGPPAVWLNDQSTLEGDRVGDALQVESGRIRGQTVLIRLPDGRSIRLKPGQRYDPETGRVVDALRQ